MFERKPKEERDSPPDGKKHFLRRRWPVLILACAAAAGAGFWILRARSVQAQPSAAYIEATPARRSITNVYSESGTIEAAESYEVKSLVRGDVLTADFEEGDSVQEGDVLYTIDSADAANSVERAQLSLAQAQRDYEDAVAAGYVTTDISGTVVSISVAPGDVVSAGQEVATIRDDSTMLLTLDFPAADAAGFSAGQEAVVTLDGTYENLSGTVRTVSGTDTQQRQHAGPLGHHRGAQCRGADDVPGSHRQCERRQRPGLGQAHQPEHPDPHRHYQRHRCRPLRPARDLGGVGQQHPPAGERQPDPPGGNRLGQSPQRGAVHGGHREHPG